MFWLGVFAFALGPSILAQLRGHHAAGQIILLNLGALGLLAWLFIWALSEPGQYSAQPLRIGMLVTAGGAWLGGFLWSLGK
jgi:hypothetical protein